MPNDAPHRLLMERIIRTTYSPTDHPQQFELLAKSGEDIQTDDLVVLDYIMDCVELLPTQSDVDAEIP